MSTLSTVAEIKSEVSRTLSKESKSVADFNSQKNIDCFLDSINDLKKVLRDGSKSLKRVDDLLGLVTWFENVGHDDEKGLMEMIDYCLEAHGFMLRQYVQVRRVFWPLNIARKEMSDFKDALDNMEESLFELNQIFFELRKDPKFNKAVSAV